MEILETIRGIFGNKVIIFPLVAYFTAQILKFIFRAVGYPMRKEHPLFLESGGMPSAHSAVVTSATIMVGYLEGVSSAIFGLAIVFAAIVIYDAIYVRGRADRQAIILNKVIDLFPKLKQNKFKKLKTQEGHTYLEVVGGVAWGIILTLSLIWLT
ncbi:divergent PAP2 family protein [Patescibacteria group bacterium]